MPRPVSRSNACGGSFAWLCLLPLWFLAQSAFAHTITGNDANYIQVINGPAIAPFVYLGAKHMVTGIDHLLYLFGVVFFLYRPVHILQYVSLFALGHSITLLAGVLANLQVNAFLIDGIIGLSIVYKAFENLGGFSRLGRLRPNPKIAVLCFGLFHGLGLATKLQAFALSQNGLVTNIVSFNLGVEMGQLLALSGILLVITLLRRQQGFSSYALVINTLLMAGGFALSAYQFTALATALSG